MFRHLYGGASYNVKLFTIEHVLPQNPGADSDWMQLWPNVDQRKYWLNRIANLVPLTRQRNSSAQNYDFATKKAKYFQTKNGTSSFTLTTQVISLPAWTPAVVAQRQKDILSLLSDNWFLSADNSSDTQMFLLAGRGGNASGYPVENDQFVVKAGSSISASVTDGIQQSYADLRAQLIFDKVIVNNVFVKDYTFTSVSAAAAVILGRAANGRKEWTHLDGRSFGQIGH